MGLRKRILRRLRHGAVPTPTPAPTPTLRRRPPPPTLDAYVLTHPSLSTLQAAHLHPDFAAALHDGSPAALRSTLSEVHPDIYALRPMSDAWQQMMLEEVFHFEQWVLETGCRHDPPNSMNQYGVILDQIGLQGALAALTETAVRPLAAQVFPQVGATLDEHHGFVVEYRPGADVDLGFHVDASDVTLNLCLGSIFSGGQLYFEGRRCESHRQTGCSDSDRFVWEHAPGTALLHAGKHRHGALRIASGERINLILWCRDSQAVPPEDCPPWCQESMRR